MNFIDFIDRMMAACVFGLVRAGMFLAILWARLVFVLLCLAFIGVVGLIGMWAIK